MKSRDFCFWLQGVFEVGELKTLNEQQVECIKRHLNLVFVHEIDPSMGDAKHQAKLNEVHQGGSVVSVPSTDGLPVMRC